MWHRGLSALLPQMKNCCLFIEIAFSSAFLQGEHSSDLWQPCDLLLYLGTLKSYNLLATFKHKRIQKILESE